ncbi:MAG: 6-phosphofructokinase, partial [bacterium]|nr:6-phosphofructokinase [bacterium]
MLRVGILTSGGDAPGLNAFLAFLRAMLTNAYGEQVEIIGFKFGYEGLCRDIWIQITSAVTTGIKRIAGSVLGCNKAFFFSAEKGKEALATIKKHRLDALVVAGGDGTRRGLEKTLMPALKADGYQLTLIHVSKSIDNNNASVRSIGFYTASQEVMSTFDKLNATAKTHRRYFIVEIMGDNSVELSLSACEGGADIIVANLGREKLSYEGLVKNVASAIAKRVAKGKDYGSVALMEKTVPNVDQFTKDVEKILHDDFGCLEQTVRSVNPAHTLRGSVPVERDRQLANRFAFGTLEAITKKNSGTIVYNAGRTQRIAFDDDKG